MTVTFFATVISPPQLRHSIFLVFISAHFPFESVELPLKDLHLFQTLFYETLPF